LRKLKFKKLKRGQQARRVFRKTDLWVLGRHDAGVPLLTLSRDGESLVATDKDRANARIAKLQAILTRSETRLKLHQGRWDERENVRQKDQSALDAWENLATKLTVLKLPAVARAVILTFLAFLDFVVFARVAAVALDVEASFSNPEYWIGGMYGLFVSIVAFMLGRALKESRVYAAQGALMTEERLAAIRNDEDYNPAPRARADKQTAALAVSSLLFLILVGLAGWARFKANVDENEAFSALGLLIPVLIIFVEFFLHDPLAPSVTNRRPLHVLLSRKVTKTTNSIDLFTKLRDGRVLLVESYYAAEEADLLLRLNNVGIRN